MKRIRRVDPAQVADEDLLARAAEGDEDAFGVLYDRHATVAFSLALRMLGSRSAAEDLVQDAFLAVWRGALAYVPQRGSVRTWILSIVHHRGVDRLRTQQVAGRRDEALRLAAVVEDGAVDLTSEEALGRVQSAAVKRAVASLPGEQAQVIQLGYFGGFTHHEIAEMLDLPLGTVKSRMRLALERLRAALRYGEGVPQ